MKHIKLFEELSNGKMFWKIRTDETYYNLSLKKIGMTEPYLSRFVDNRQITTDSKQYGNFIYVCFNPYEVKEGIWGWNHGLDSDFYYFEKRGYLWMGEVEIPEYEADSIKYNL